MNRWEQVEKLCQAALELEENQRAAFLEDACACDEELRREVEGVLPFQGMPRNLLCVPLTLSNYENLKIESRGAAE